MIRRKIILAAAVIAVLSVRVQAQESEKLSILFTGDIMGHDTQIASAYDSVSKSYDYTEVFRYISPVLSEPDITIANLEVTLAGPPYKGYPQFSSPAALARAGFDAGIDFFVLANNHSADRGKKGILSTIHKLDSMEIPHTGTWKDKASRDSLSPVIIKKNNFSIALLNYTYGTNGIRVPAPLIVDSLDTELVISDIKKAKSQNPDAVILFLHWGTEYDTIPRKEQTVLADQFMDAGADIIIGSHPHVIQKMVWKKDEGRGPVAYSLGNFVSNQRKPKTDGGSIVRIELRKEEGITKVANAGYYLTWVYTPVEDSRLNFYILPCAMFENRRDFFNEDSSFEMMTKFINESRKLLGAQNEGFPEYGFGPYIRENVREIE